MLVPQTIDRDKEETMLEKLRSMLAEAALAAVEPKYPGQMETIVSLIEDVRAMLVYAGIKIPIEPADDNGIGHAAIAGLLADATRSLSIAHAEGTPRSHKAALITCGTAISTILRSRWISLFRDRRKDSIHAGGVCLEGLELLRLLVLIDASFQGETSPYLKPELARNGAAHERIHLALERFHRLSSTDIDAMTTDLRAGRTPRRVT